MDRTWIIDIGKMIEMLIPLSLFLLALLSTTSFRSPEPRPIPLRIKNKR